jgi:hypothetical protein
MVEYADTQKKDAKLIAASRRIAERLLSSAPVAELDSIQPVTDDRTFDALAKAVRDSIEGDEPESGLDRLHTYAVKYVRLIAANHGLGVTKDKPLHSTFGEYVGYLRKNGLLESEMTERILKSAISTLEAFNHVRNNQSLAHDNKTLNYEESLLIYNHVCSSIRFIQSVEHKLDSGNVEETDDPDDTPF